MSATRRARRRGFSTVEALVGAAVALSALATTVVFFDAQQKAIGVQSAYSQSQSVTRTAVDLMSRELRMAGYDPTGRALAASTGPSCPGRARGIVQARVDRLRFRQDLNGDGVIKGAGEDLRYRLDGSRLVRRDGKAAPLALATNVPKGGVVFRYFTEGSTPVELVPGPALSKAERDCVASIRMALSTPAERPARRRLRRLVPMVETEIAIRSRALLRF